MKKETAKKNKLWLWIGLGVVALLAVVGIVLALVLGGGQQGKSGGRPDLYWNVDRVAFTKDSESGLSTREPAADGMYYVKFAYNGEQVELPVADKRLINFIDTMDLMGLVIDNDGIVTDAVDPTEIAVEKGKGIYYVETKDGVIKANSAITLNGLAMDFAVTENTQVYNVSSTASVVGERIQPEDVQLMDTIHVYANDQDEITHVYLAVSPLQSKIYWRMDQFWNSTLKETSREPDENGVYHIPYWCEGEEVDIKIKDRKLVTEIDSRSFYWPHSSFRFDEEGYAVARINTGTATRTISLVDCYDVMEIDGNNISTQPFGNGTPVNFKVTENTRIYDVSSLAKAIGTAGQRVDSLKINDRVSVWTDKDNNAVLIYIASRRAESPIYYNVKKQWNSTDKITRRTPNADGLYEIDLWSEEEGIKTYLMTLEQVNMVDGEAYRICGLKADGNLVQEVYPLESLFGYPAVCNGRWVTDITGSIFTIISPANFTSTNWLMTADCKIIDVSDTNNPKPTELRVGDNVRVFRNPPGEVVCIFVCARQAGGDALYYNLDRQYDDKAKATKRTPDENGWYVFDVAHNGKTMQVKTRDKELANTLESYNPGAVCLVVENGIVKKVMDPNTAYCGSKVASAFYFEGYTDLGEAIFGYEGRDDLIYEVSEDLEVFDVSTNSFRNRGAKTTLQEGDWVTCFTDMYGKLRVVFVRARSADCAAYSFDRMLSGTTTTRVPDADGWYVYNMAINGKVKTVKTKDKDLASAIDYRANNAMGLVLDGDVITGYTPASSIPGINANGVRGYDVVKISGRTLTVRYEVTGSVNTGKEQTITIASNATIYDVSTGDLATFGQKTNFSSIKVGDRITTLKDKNGNHALVYVTHKGGRTAYCPHCDKNVYWCAWAGDGLNAADNHLIMTRDVNTPNALSANSASAEYTVVLDLAGHTLTRTRNYRALIVGNKESMYIMDSVGGGKVRTTGANGQNAGVAQIATGGKFYLMGGTLEQIANDNIKVPNGGVVNMSGDGSEFHMSGGKLLNGVANQGACLYTSNGIVDITGGVIEGGSADLYGGNIYFYGATSVNMENVTIIGGNAKNGGNIVFNTLSNYTIKNCKIVDGVASNKGGNIYANANKLTLTNCTVSGGKAGVMGNNIYLNSGTLTLAGGAMENGDLMSNKGTKLVLTGDYKADTLNLVSGSTVDLNGWTPSTAMKVNAEDVFTTELSNLDAIKDYIKVGTEGAELKVEGGKLSMTGAVLPAEPEIDVTDPTICPHCGEKWENITWSAWTGKADPASGHYKLEKDMTVAHINIGNAANQDAQIMLDLNGHILKGNDGDYVLGIGLAKGQPQFSIMDSVGGGEIQATGIEGGNGVIMVMGGTKLNIFGGTIRHLNTAGTSNRYGALYCNNATVNMYGGKILDGYSVATQSEAAGNVLVRGTSVFNMYGGEISGGYSASKAGGINVYGSAPVFNMYGGVIKDNKTDGVGGNIYVSGSTATISGGTISGGLSGEKVDNINVTGKLTISGGTIDGGIIGKFASLKVEGNPVIKANTIGLEIANGKTVTLGELTEGAEIWVNANGVFTTENAKAADYATYFKTNIEGASIEAQGNVLAVTGVGGNEPENDFECPHCGLKASQITWEPWTATADPASGHYKLEDHLTTTWHINIGNANNLDADIVLDLNGKTWKSNGGYVMGIGTAGSSSIKFSIMDSVGGGEIQGTGVADGVLEDRYDNTAVIALQNNAVLNIYGGTLRQLPDENVKIELAGVIYNNNGILNMYGGKITDGYVPVDAASTAGNVFLRGTGKFYMHGGEISNGYAVKNAGGVLLYAANTEFVMDGGTLSGNTTDGVGGNIYVANADAKVTIGGDAVITGGVGSNGNDNINCRGNLTINGGTIDGGIIGNFKSLTVSGAPVIKANGVGLAIPEGKTITLGELTDGANIWVNAKGTFTAVNEKAAEYKKYFHTNVEGVYVDAENNTLVIKEGENPDLLEKCPHCNVAMDQITWTAWDGSANPASGHYRLETDLQTAHTNIGNGVNTDADVVLDLNGHILKGNDGDYVIGVGFGTNTNKLSIFDSVGGGELQATGMTDDAGVVKVASGAEFNLYSGTLRQLYSKDAIPALGVLYVKDATVNMAGGKITDGYTTTTNSTSGGNVLLRGASAVMNMSGGEIVNGYALTNGGGVSAVGGTLNMTGGKIYNNITEGIGGNLFIGGGFAAATVSGDAEIFGGVAGGFGANIYNNKATTVLDGITKVDGDIYANVALTLKGTVNIPMGNSNGLMIKNGVTLDLSQMNTDSLVYFGVNLAAISGQTNSATFTKNGGDGYLSCFRNVGRTTSVKAEGGELVAYRLANNAAAATEHWSWCPHCDEYVQWKRVGLWATYHESVTHYYNYNNTNRIASVAGTYSANCVVDMAGYAMDMASGNAFITVGGTGANVSILDTVGGGKLKAVGSSSVTGGAIVSSVKTDYNSTINLYSGTLTGEALRGGAITMYHGTLNMYGGIIKDSKCTNNNANGGAVWVGNSADGTFNMSGGLISNCQNTNGNAGSVAVKQGTFNMTGGIIQGGSAKTNSGNVTIQGAGDHVISNAIIRGGSSTSDGQNGGNLCIAKTSNFEGAANVTITNSTICGGIATGNGGNIYVDNVAKFDMIGCVVYGGTATEGANVYVTEGVTYNPVDCKIDD